MFSKKLSELNRVLQEFKSKPLPTLYHVTTESNAKNILENGLVVSHMGKNHGSMEIQPSSQMIYLSRHPNSNNLPCNLFDSNERLVSLEIDPSCINIHAIFPDDGMFAAIGNEDFFIDIDDIIDELNIPEEEASIVLDKTFELTSDTINDWKDFACWYLHTQGEISTPNNIPAKFIKFSHYL